VQLYVFDWLRQGVELPVMLPGAATVICSSLHKYALYPHALPERTQMLELPQLLLMPMLDEKLTTMLDVP